MSTINNGTAAASRVATLLQKGGFAAFSALLLAIVVWTIHRSDQRFEKLLEIQQQSNQVIERNTAAIQELSKAVHTKL